MAINLLTDNATLDLGTLGRVSHWFATVWEWLVWNNGKSYLKWITQMMKLSSGYRFHKKPAKKKFNHLIILL
jgi:hypothetical protein